MDHSTALPGGETTARGRSSNGWSTDWTEDRTTAWTTQTAHGGPSSRRRFDPGHSLPRVAEVVVQPLHATPELEWEDLLAVPGNPPSPRAGRLRMTRRGRCRDPEEWTHVIHAQIVGAGTLRSLPNSCPSTFRLRTRKDGGGGAAGEVLMSPVWSAGLPRVRAGRGIGEARRHAPEQPNPRAAARPWGLGGPNMRRQVSHEVPYRPGPRHNRSPTPPPACVQPLGRWASGKR